MFFLPFYLFLLNINGYKIKNHSNNNDIAITPAQINDIVDNPNLPSSEVVHLPASLHTFPLEQSLLELHSAPCAKLHLLAVLSYKPLTHSQLIIVLLSGQDNSLFDVQGVFVIISSSLTSPAPPSGIQSNSVGSDIPLIHSSVVTEVPSSHSFTVSSRHTSTVLSSSSTIGVQLE